MFASIVWNEGFDDYIVTIMDNKGNVLGSDGLWNIDYDSWMESDASQGGFLL